MFNTKKKLKEIEKKIKLLQKEKVELLKIKEMLNDNSPKIDAAELFIFNNGKIKYIVRKEEKKIYSKVIKSKPTYYIKLTNIFDNSVVFEHKSYEKYTNYINTYISGNNIKKGYLIKIQNIVPNILAYADNKVPIYVLQRLFYKLNDINLLSPILQKK